MLRIKHNTITRFQLLVEAEHKSELPLISIERYLDTKPLPTFFVHANIRNIGHNLCAWRD